MVERPKNKDHGRKEKNWEKLPGSLSNQEEPYGKKMRDKAWLERARDKDRRRGVEEPGKEPGSSRNREKRRGKKDTKIKSW